MYRKLLMGVLVTALVVTAASVAFGGVVEAEHHAAHALAQLRHRGQCRRHQQPRQGLREAASGHQDPRRQPAGRQLLRAPAVLGDLAHLARPRDDVDGPVRPKYAKFLLNLKPYFTSAQTSKLNGISYMAPDFNIANGFLVMPLENQFYIGFYNKALFAKAGSCRSADEPGTSCTRTARSSRRRASRR